MKRYQLSFHTFGCKVNTYDTGLLQKRLAAHGSLSHAQEETIAEAGAAHDRGSGPRIHILNTCAVTAEATKEAAKLVRKIKARDPISTVVITGCGAQVDGAVFDELPGVDLVVANSHKGQLESILDRYFARELEGRVFRSNIFRKDDLEAGGGEETAHTRAFLKIQDGCNSFCTYCVIPFARGKSRSLPVRDLVARIRELHAGGVNEVVLTGVHIADYEDVQGQRKFFLRDLIDELLQKTEIPRLRLSSLEPVELSREILKLFQNERLCRHFHMSIQSATTSVLKGMRRRYDAHEVEDSLRLIAAELPDAFVGMDVIAGFPGESENDFLETFERLDGLPWTRLHVFPYSERPGTKAISLPAPVPREVRVARSRRLRELSRIRFEARARAQIGKDKQILLLNAPGKGAEGLSRDYWPVTLHRNSVATEQGQLPARAGSEVWARVSDYLPPTPDRMDGVLLAERLRET